MTIDLHPDDEDLLGKLRAIPPGDREAVLVHILSSTDWKPDRIWETVHEWLVLSIRREHSPGDPQLAMQLGEVTERLRWVAHRAPVTGTTPETLALERQKARRALLEDRAGKRSDDNTYRRDTAEEWRTIAREHASKRKKHSHAGKRIEDSINDELEKRGFERMADSTIRKAIRGVKRPS
ncbi:hypothetical protein AB7M17_005270 [Bradyrhizobium sp. USDA 377]